MIASPWLFLLGFVLAAIAGTVATDLTREEFSGGARFELSWRFWQWPKQQSLAFAGLLWLLVLLITTITSSHWADLLIGSVAGGAAAPWVWLHFVRSYDRGERDPTEREALTKRRAYYIWQEERQPEDRADANYYAAKKQVEDDEHLAIERSAKSAEGLLARYRLLSIVLGTGLLVAVLLPVLKNWLFRTQQFQAFGISLTLTTAQPSNQGRTIGDYQNPPNSDPGGDRLSKGTKAAYRVAAPNKAHSTSVHLVGLDLKNFENLSMIDRDRAFIAWLYTNREKDAYTAKKSVDGRDTTPTLKRYIEDAQDLLKHGNPTGSVDPNFDTAFATDSAPFSDCLQNFAKKTLDPRLFTLEVGRSLRSFVDEVYHQWSAAGELKIQEYFLEYEQPQNQAACDFRSTSDALITLATGQFEISPYPSLIAAYYLAAIGAVDTGVLLLEHWKDHFEKEHQTFTPEEEPQLGWYLWRAKWAVSSLPYQFGGVAVPHRDLVFWQNDETNQLARMLQVGDAEGWKRLCNRLLRSTPYNNIGQLLALTYAMERFYLFENLSPDDFDKSNQSLGLASLEDYLREAKAIRDNQACIERVPNYWKAQREYRAYFHLYIAQLSLVALARDEDSARRHDLIEAIGQELREADNFGEANKPSGLLDSSDDWETHRVRLRLLTKQLEDAKRDSGW